MNYPYKYFNTTISQREYAARRELLMANMDPNSIAIVPSAQLVVRSNDTEYKFRQDSDFYYLSGFNEPNAVLVLLPNRKQGQVIYFVQDKDKERELWDGYRVGPDGMSTQYGADDAFPINDIDDILPGMLEGRERVYYTIGQKPEFDQQIMSWIKTLRTKTRSGAHSPGEFSDLNHLLHDMRLFKSAQELKLMREAAAISCQAHNHAMAIVEPDMNEGQLEAEYLYQFAVRGAASAAYNTIVGGGANACVLHYVENNQTLRNGDLVLVDAGCELQGYAADITRTFPVNGRFSKAQQALYEVVLEAQSAAINVMTEGCHWNEPHDQSVSIISQGLIDLGLLKGDLNEVIETERYKQFYMHRVGEKLQKNAHAVSVGQSAKRSTKRLVKKESVKLKAKAKTTAKSTVKKKTKTKAKEKTPIKKAQSKAVVKKAAKKAAKKKVSRK